MVLQLVWRLPDTSLTTALVQGGREHFGWGLDRHLRALIYDGVNFNTAATGQYAKGKRPKLPPFPRPKPKKQHKKATVKDLFHQMKRGG